MPEINSVKTYKAGGIYHVYNRGVQKRKIFHSMNDYRIFLAILQRYLRPVDHSISIEPGPRPRSYSKEIEIYAFCLMPNHFHFLLKQKDIRSMPKFIKSVALVYTCYFNRKYNTVGTLWQGRYKANRIHTSGGYRRTLEYIHKNPINLAHDPKQYEFSSCKDYETKRRFQWLIVRKDAP